MSVLTLDSSLLTHDSSLLTRDSSVQTSFIMAATVSKDTYWKYLGISNVIFKECFTK